MPVVHFFELDQLSRSPMNYSVYLDFEHRRPGPSSESRVLPKYVSVSEMDIVLACRFCRYYRVSNVNVPFKPDVGSE